jgi:hypothetical protein
LTTTLYAREFTHPTQASRVRLRVYQPETGGFLVTEERTGTTTVVATLGLFDSQEAARARVLERARGLEQQRYRPAD